MAPVSSNNRPSPDDPTPAEIEAGACLPREPEPLASRLTQAPPPPTPAVTALVDKHPPGGAGKSSHPGLALSVGINFASPGKTVGVEASLGVIVDLSEPKISAFSSSSSGKAASPGVSTGVSAQVSLVGDVTKFWGSGAELGLNLPRFGAALNFATPAPGGPLEFNGVTGSVGVSVGVDGHCLEGTTTEHWSVGLNDIKDALQRVSGLPGPRRFGP